MLKPSIHELLPWYLNGTLSEKERLAVESSLKLEPEILVELKDWQQLHAAIVAQPVHIPSPLVQRQLLSAIRTRRSLALPQRLAFNVLILAMVTLAVFLVLWSVVQPGVVLQWSVENDGISAYRLYRALRGSEAYHLVREVPVRVGTTVYTCVDAFLLPGQSYIYRLEAVRSAGQVVMSNAVAGDASEVLPGQLALLIASVMIGYGLVQAYQNWPGLFGNRIRRSST